MPPAVGGAKGVTEKGSGGERDKHKVPKEPLLRHGKEQELRGGCRREFPTLHWGSISGCHSLPLPHCPTAPGHGGAAPPMPKEPGGLVKPPLGHLTGQPRCWQALLGLGHHPTPRPRAGSAPAPRPAQQLWPGTPCSSPAPAHPMEGPPGRFGESRLSFASAGFAGRGMLPGWGALPRRFGTTSPNLPVFSLKSEDEPSAGQKNTAGGRKSPN